MVDFICEWLGLYFDLPCSYTVEGQDIPEYMTERCPDWCDKSCGIVPASECWKKYFKMLKEDKSDDSRRTKKLGSGS